MRTTGNHWDDTQTPGIFDNKSDLNQTSLTLLCDDLREKVKDFDLFEAVYLYDVPQGEVARRLGISLRTLRKKLKNVKDRLNRYLGRKGKFAL